MTDTYREKRYAYTGHTLTPYEKDDGTVDPYGSISVCYYTESERQKFMAMLSGGLVSGSNLRIEKVGSNIGIGIDDKLLMSIDRATNLINKQENTIRELLILVADLKEEVLDLKEAVFNE